MLSCAFHSLGLFLSHSTPSVLHYSYFFVSRCYDRRDLHSFPTRRSSDLIAGMHAHRIEVLDRADDDAIVLLVARSESTRLNSSHLVISYAVFCLKKKKAPKRHQNTEHSAPLRYQMR